ncbi:MAG: rod shape-determining protein MreD [bacterium]|nr:rod shape-determining protein MreD [bacterium]
MRYFLQTSLIWILVAFVGETLISPAISIKGISPDFSIIALVVLSLAAGPMPGTVGGFVLGLIQDLSNPALLGLHALCKCTLGFSLGALRSRLVHGMPVAEGIVVALAVLAHDLVFLLVQSRLVDEAFLNPLLTESFPVAIYSGVAGMLIIRLADLVGIMGQED